ncbi:TPA: outer membrane protein assembly factor BamD [Legionella pneumophila]|nr:outer membrane protein assembly factor BamD [Legionella pneumophila]HAT2065972.1 outer membrane protein assembly factor BamD [Legionella pneumophila]HAT8591255.1 outer membrane protein assembly factor BamD [Legionella pneumophila]HAU1576178.1 outer membrane protein assembly factor BamD [Legionella pneumophila]HAU1680026.1 outer membrane protein assembly factor BamD [Legionella pneumophila]HAU3699862.1 outer membrane protein assembly factor BamD [Legionella pneumophila]
MKRIHVLFLIGLVVGISSCAKWGKDDEDNNPYKGMTAKQLYTAAQTSLKKEEYATAAKQLEAMESMYPFSDYTESSQMQLIYAYYKDEDYPSAAATAERFIHLYPRAKNVDYAYYMKGLANFQQTRGVFAKMLPMDESWRDPGTQTQALVDFATLIQKFPDSKYKANALQRMIYLRNMFAQHELNVSLYYFKRKMYVAAIERASYLVKNYPQAPSAQKALVVMYEANKALGLNKAAEDAMAVYKATYHTSNMVRINS